MARTGKITLYEGVSKTSKKPYTGLLLTVGSWSELYFPKSSFEMDYIKKHLRGEDDSDAGKIDLNEEDAPKKGGKGLFS